MSCLYNRRLLFRVLVDTVSISLVAVGILAIQNMVKPFHRGFFCDDESIQYPFLPDTVPMSLAVSVGILLPMAVIVLLEFLLRNSSRANIISTRKKTTGGRTWIVATYNTVTVFLFGMTVTQFLTDVGKFSVGRLRPHFLALCKPDFSKFNCSDGYITEDVCTITESFPAKDARLSFPSGHSSFSMYCMLYLILYIQAKIVSKTVVLLKHFLQLVFFTMSFFTCLSRISDYKHHWSDVLAGAILGMVVCICVVLSLADFGQFLCCSGVDSKIVVPGDSHSIEEGSETSYYGSTTQTGLDSQERQQLLQPGIPK
ncbi:hypothetical protein BsWGS_19424 [Bradybaena similaris]